MRFYITLLFFLSINLFVTNRALAHPVHISVVNLDFKENKDITFSVKLFRDDFSKILNKNNKTQIQIDEKTKLKEIDKYVIAYIYKHFRLQENSKIDDYQLKKMKISGLAVWFYFTIKNQKKKLKTLKIRNSLMTDLYPDQTNLFIMNYKGEDFAYSYNNSDRAFTFVLEK